MTKLIKNNILDYPMLVVDSKLSAPPRGIDNRGNSCYQNAVLQTLLSISEFSKFCLDPNIEEFLKEGRDREWLLNLVEFVRNYYYASDHKYAETYLKYLNNICRLTTLERHQQEDASELLGKIIDTITDYFIGYPESLQAKEYLYPDINPVRGALNIKAGQAVFFNGTAGSTTDKRRIIQKVDNANYLDLTLNREKYLKSEEISLTELITDYNMLDVERKEGVNPTKGSPLVVNKLTKYSILRIEKYIIIRLTRERYNTETKGMSRISIPVYMPYYYNFRELLNLDRSSQSVSPHAYSLISVIHHVGRSLNSGHYTADVLRGDRWYNCDDGKVRFLSDEHIDHMQHSSSGYIYVYRRLENISTETAQLFEPISYGISYKESSRLNFIESRRRPHIRKQMKELPIKRPIRPLKRSDPWKSDEGSSPVMSDGIVSIDSTISQIDETTPDKLSVDPYSEMFNMTYSKYFHGKDPEHGKEPEDVYPDDI